MKNMKKKAMTGVAIKERLKELEIIMEKREILNNNEILELESFLSAKHRHFAREYVISGAGKASALKAGYDEKSATTLAGNMLRDPKIKLYIMVLRKLQQMEEMVDKQMLLEEHKRIAFFDASTVIDFDERGKPIVNAERLKRSGAVIKKIKFNVKSSNLEIEFYDKQKSLDELGRHLGFYEEDNNQKKIDAVAIYLPGNERESNRNATEDGDYIELPVSE